MGLPYQTEDYDEVGGGSGSASTVNDLGGMNFSTLDNNEIMKKVDANNVGGTNILSIAYPAVSNISSNALTYYDGDDNLVSSITHVKDTSIPANDIHKVNILPNGGQSQYLTVLHSSGDAECRVGINIPNPEDALDIEGNIQLASGGTGKIKYKDAAAGHIHAELDSSGDGANGGQFVIRTKVDGGTVTDKLTINNLGNAVLNGNHFAQAYYFAKYGVPRSAERLKVTKEEILSLDSVSQSLPDPNKSEPISCQGLLDCASNAVIASTNASGLHTLPPSGSVIKSYLDSFSGINQVNILSVKKTSTQVIASGGTSKIVSWATPHVDINTGSSGWDNANSRYVIQNSATYKISFSAIINNSGNDTSSLRFLNGAVKIYNTGATLLHTESDTTILYNVDNTAGRTERGSVHIEIIRTLNATDYIETEIASLESTGNYNIEGATLNVEQVSYGTAITMQTPINHVFYNTTDTSLKSGNGTGGHNNNTYGSWVGIYNQSNVLQLSPSITLNDSTSAVKIETNIHARVDRVTLGFRIIRAVSGLADVVVVGSEQWGRTVPYNVVDDDHHTYCVSLVDTPNATNVTYRAEVYAYVPAGTTNTFFEINANLSQGGTQNVNMLLTEWANNTIVNQSITAPTYKTTALPTLTTEIGYNSIFTISSGVTIPKFDVSPFYVTFGSFTGLTGGVYLIVGSFTTDGLASNYGTAAILHDGTSNIHEQLTVVVAGGYTSNYVSHIFTIPHGTTKTIEFRGNVNTTTTIQTILSTTCSIVRIA